VKGFGSKKKLAKRDAAVKMLEVVNSEKWCWEMRWRKEFKGPIKLDFVKLTEKLGRLFIVGTKRKRRICGFMALTLWKQFESWKRFVIYQNICKKTLSSPHKKHMFSFQLSDISSVVARHRSHPCLIEKQSVKLRISTGGKAIERLNFQKF
jgi:hypothetical protein